uniref:PHD finger protein 1 n=1 Tax=Accipiter nisus TaxID=211598 RepID=A0A8B9MXQ2_9AVES
MASEAGAPPTRPPRCPPPAPPTPPRFWEGQDVLARWTDGLLYLGTIKKVDAGRRGCLVQFEDNSQFLVLWKDISPAAVPGEEQSCCVCSGRALNPENLLVRCEKCGHEGGSAEKRPPRQSDAQHESRPPLSTQDPGVGPPPPRQPPAVLLLLRGARRVEPEDAAVPGLRPVVPRSLHPVPEQTPALRGPGGRRPPYPLSPERLLQEEIFRPGTGDPALRQRQLGRPPAGPGSSLDGRSRSARDSLGCTPGPPPRCPPLLWGGPPRLPPPRSPIAGERPRPPSALLASPQGRAEGGPAGAHPPAVPRAPPAAPTTSDAPMPVAPPAPAPPSGCSPPSTPPPTRAPASGGHWGDWGPTGRVGGSVLGGLGLYGEQWGCTGRAGGCTGRAGGAYWEYWGLYWEGWDHTGSTGINGDPQGQCWG